ncbi:MAG: cytochrome d ubiquinol oxidase subunit II [Elusimicrobiota bacterium]
MRLEALSAGAIFLSLNVYVITGGADFGGGVWDLLALGPRAGRQREVIARAIAPIWEANHVWLIAAIVLFFTAFPAAFATVTITLNIPLSLMLIGIVLRGSAFIFRSLTRERNQAYQRWSLVFAVSSMATPIMLGITIGAIASGRIKSADAPDLLRPWLAPFPLAVGLLALALFAFLAAVYLAMETQEPDLRGDFRKRAGLALGASAILAAACFWLARSGAPLLFQNMRHARWTTPLIAFTAALAAGSATALRKELCWLARLFSAATVSGVLWGWALAQYPYLVVPDFSLANTAAPASVLRPVLGVLVVGTALVTPAFVYLYAVFKRL